MVSDLLAFIFAERCLGWAGGLVLVSKPKKNEILKRGDEMRWSSDVSRDDDCSVRTTFNIIFQLSRMVLLSNIDVHVTCLFFSPRNM